jgi:hypothetical protein
VLNARAIWGTGTDQNYTGTYTGATLAVDQNATLTTTWQRFSYTGSIGATATEVAMQFQYTPSGTAGTNDYFEITGVQWEVGSVATPFHTYAATIQGELAACQRYYYRWSAADNLVSYFSPIWVFSATAAYGVFKLPQTMRVKPTSIETSGTASHYRFYAGSGNYACTSVPTLDVSNADVVSVEYNASAENNQARFQVTLRNQKKIPAHYLCIASGGFPKKSQYEWIEKLKHSIEYPVPSLFTFNIPVNV